MSEIRDETEMFAEARKRGCVVLWPRANELFIDIDSAEDYARYKTALPIFREIHPVIETKETPSPSGKPWRMHIIVKLASPVPDDTTRIYWQALLGSDAGREALALKHLRDGHPPTVFFEKPDVEEIESQPKMKAAKKR